MWSQVCAREKIYLLTGAVPQWEILFRKLIKSAQSGFKSSLESSPRTFFPHKKSQ